MQALYAPRFMMKTSAPLKPQMYSVTKFGASITANKKTA
jgi:hypothetical protein